MKRIHNPLLWSCHSCGISEAMLHNKLYWHDGEDSIESGFFCRHCYNTLLIAHERPYMQYDWYRRMPIGIRYNKTLRECTTDLITKTLTGEQNENSPR